MQQSKLHILFAICLLAGLACSSASNPKAKNTTTPTATTSQATAAKPNNQTTKTTASKTNPKPKLSNQGVEINFKASPAKSGTESCVDVVVKQFSDVVSMQYSINWNPKDLAYKSVKGFNLKDLSKNNFGTHKAKEGKLTFSWYDQAIKGVSVTDNTSIHQVCFDVTAKKNTKTKLQITEDPIIVEITGQGGKFLKLFTETAYVKVK